MAWDFGTPLIEPKTPFYSRFQVLAVVLPNRVNNAISRRLTTKAASLRAADPEQEATWRDVCSAGSLWRRMARLWWIA
jgi:hypothetical protein